MARPANTCAGGLGMVTRKQVDRSGDVAFQQGELAVLTTDVGVAGRGVVT